MKTGRSANGKGHYWTIHPANLEDFSRGDFRRRRAQRRVRRSLGLTVPEEDDEDDEELPLGDGLISPGCLSPSPGVSILNGVGPSLPFLPLGKSPFQLSNPSGFRNGQINFQMPNHHLLGGLIQPIPVLKRTFENEFSDEEW